MGGFLLPSNPPLLLNCPEQRLERPGDCCASDPRSAPTNARPRKEGSWDPESFYAPMWGLGDLGGSFEVAGNLGRAGTGMMAPNNQVQSWVCAGPGDRLGCWFQGGDYGINACTVAFRNTHFLPFRGAVGGRVLSHLTSGLYPGGPEDAGCPRLQPRSSWASALCNATSEW